MADIPKHLTANAWKAAQWDEQFSRVSCVNRPDVTYSPPDPVSDYLPHGALQVTVDAHAYDNFKEGNVFAVSLQNSSLSATRGGRAYYKELGGLTENYFIRVRGPFLEWVTMEVWMEDMNDPVGQGPNPKFELRQCSPGTTIVSSELTSSTNWNFDLSAGTFGTSPTVNGGVGFNIGQTISAQLPGLKVTDLHDQQRMFHRYELGTLRDGHAYNSHDDLYDSGAFFQGYPLREFTDIATSNWPLISQAIFVCRDKTVRRMRVMARMTGNVAVAQSGFTVFRADIAVQQREVSIEAMVELDLDKPDA
ncbi:hypothetical protein [Ideonella livida]|uniref:Uncharacterized protein n=1 Tax=Ideonella livida TaxID=2707176 RepID=A0A7C9PFW5_9BURK|nr:hypothetical protein [Ideonella livida]NDY90392.1 hypothetical protein [Ideonella livida]